MTSTVFAPHVQRFLDSLKQGCHVGSRMETIEVLNPKSGSPNYNKNDLCDIFDLAIPYGGQKLQWEVMFLQNHPDFPPDFVFDDRHFMPDIQDIHSLRDWRPTDPESFLSVIRELIEAYRKDSVTRLESYSRLCFEYTSLLQQNGMQEGDIEVLLNRKNRNGPVSFHMKLDVDFSKIPAIFTEDDLKEDVAYLTITFQNPNGGKAIPKLHFSPGLECILGGEYFVNACPPFPSGACLMDYVPIVENLLTDKVDQLVYCLERRKEYFSAFLDLFGRSILEYDPEKFSKLSFLFEWNDFYFIVHISIPEVFPQERPKLQFQSIYSCIHGQPFKFNSNNYAYNSKWSGVQMAEKTRIAILECVSEFQRASLKKM